MGIKTYPTGNALFMSVFFGVAIPVISSLIPIKEALKTNLNIAIDQLKSGGSAMKVKISQIHKETQWGSIFRGIRISHWCR